VVFNDGGTNYDFRIEGDTNANLFFVDASADAVGLGTSTPGGQLEIFRTSTTDPSLRLRYNSTSYYGDHLMDSNGNYIIYSPAANGVTSGNLRLRAGGLFSISTNDQAATSPALTIDTSSRVGIGSTSPSSKLSIATSANSQALDITDASTSDFIITPGVSSGVCRIGPATGAMALYTGNTERARLTSDGKLLVGTSSTSTAAKLAVQGRTGGDPDGQGTVYVQRGGGSGSVISNQGIGIGDIYFADSAGNSCAAIAAASDGAWSNSNDFPGRLVFSTTADGASSPTERMRINSAGRATFYNGDGYVTVIRSSNAAGTTNLFLGCTSGATNIDGSGSTLNFQIFTNGNVQNTNNSYGSLSDIKLKENIVDANSQWDDLKALQVRNYNFKEGQTHTQIGLIAQEAELVSPGLVTESPDRDEEGNDLGTVTKSVNYSVLYMKAVKALQVAMERIDVLEQRLTDAGID
jgi:hypothetical protein